MKSLSLRLGFALFVVFGLASGARADLPSIIDVASEFNQFVFAKDANYLNAAKLFEGFEGWLRAIARTPESHVKGDRGAVGVDYKIVRKGNRITVVGDTGWNHADFEIVTTSNSVRVSGDVGSVGVDFTVSKANGVLLVKGDTGWNHTDFTISKRKTAYVVRGDAGSVGVDFVLTPTGKGWSVKGDTGWNHSDYSFD